MVLLPRIASGEESRLKVLPFVSVTVAATGGLVLLLLSDTLVPLLFGQKAFVSKPDLVLLALATTMAAFAWGYILKLRALGLGKPIVRIYAFGYGIGFIPAVLTAALIDPWGPTLGYLTHMAMVSLAAVVVTRRHVQ